MLQVPEWKRGLRGEVLGRDALPKLLPAWQDLSERSVEDNVYYSPRYARALLESAERDKNINFAVVWDRTKLIAMLPFTCTSLPIPILRPVGQAWQSKYTFGCMPLLDEVRNVEAAEFLLDVLASVREGEWIIPAVNMDGEACRAIAAALERRRLPWVTVGRFQRATLEALGTFDEHMQRNLRARRRKDVARNRRRLEELGRVEIETHSSGEGLDRAVQAFLRVEAGGWKGRRGTALACDEGTKAFALSAFTGNDNNSGSRADVLTLDGVPIAVSLIACAGRTGFAVKSCYDERYRNCSPGLLLEIEVIRGFLSGGWASRLDSATAGTHILDSLWPGRTEVADLMFSLAPRYAELRLSALHACEQARRTARAGLKGVVNAARRALDAGGPARSKGLPVAETLR